MRWPWQKKLAVTVSPVVFERLNLSPNDTLLFSTEKFLTNEQREQVVDALKDAFPGYRVGLLLGGMKASIVSKPVEKP